MLDTMFRIEDDILSGDLSYSEIAEKYGLSVSEIQDIAEIVFEHSDRDEYREDMDGDHETALASAGWGTDEDYGYANEDF